MSNGAAMIFDGTNWQPFVLGGGTTGSGSGTSFTTNSKMSMSGDQNVADKTWTKIAFDTVVVDADSECSTVNNTWTCTTAGTYIVLAVISWTASATGLRSVGISEDGNAPGVTSYINQVLAAGVLATTRPFIFGQIVCTAGQAISLWGYHSQGTTLAVDSDGSYFGVFRIA